MTERDDALFHSRGSVRHFLFSKTDTGRLDAVSHPKNADDGKALRSAFPELLCGQEFTDHAVGALESASRFSAVIIRLDQDGPDDEAAAPEGEGLLAVARILDQVCREHHGFWGGHDSGLLAGFFPAKNAPQTTELSHRIQTDLEEENQKTVSIGIAEYPTINYQKSDVLPNAIKALDHATFFGPGSAVVFDSVSLNISGDKLYEKGEIQGAIDELKTALVLDPANVNVHNSLGVCFGILGQYEPAMEAFTKVLAIEPEEYMALYNLGLVYMLKGRRDRALELFLKADKIYGEAYEIAFQTGKLYLDSGDAEKALPYLERAAVLKPEAGAVYRYLGDCRAAANRPQQAVAAYRKAIKLNPQDAASMSALGCLYEDQGENSEITLMFCRESVELAPDNALFRYRLGQLYFNQNQLDEALSEFEQALKLGHDAADDIAQVKKRIAEKGC